MRGNTCARGLLAAGIAIGGSIALDSVGGSFGLMNSAQAKEFYTRKRVNGEWVTGLFPVESQPASTHSRTRQRLTFRPKPHVARALVQAKRVTPPAPSVATTEPVRAEPGADAFDRSGVSAAAALSTPSTTNLDGGDDRLARLRNALVVRAQEIAASPTPVSTRFTSAIIPPPAPPVATPSASVPTTAALDHASQAASAPAATPPAVTPDIARASAPLEPKSVAYDFETGVKTTTYANSVVREPFDVAAARRLAIPTR